MEEKIKIRIPFKIVLDKVLKELSNELTSEYDIEDMELLADRYNGEYGILAEQPALLEITLKNK